MTILATVRALPLLKGKPEIIERELIGIQTSAIAVRRQYGDVLRHEIQDLSKLLFALPELFFRPLSFTDCRDETNKQPATVNRELSEGDLDRELLTVLTKSD